MIFQHEHLSATERKTINELSNVQTSGYLQSFLKIIIILFFYILADLLAQVFDVLKVDMKSDVAKELFLFYQATPVISNYLKPVNKVRSSCKHFFEKHTRLKCWLIY